MHQSLGRKKKLALHVLVWFFPNLSDDKTLFKSESPQVPQSKLAGTCLEDTMLLLVSSRKAHGARKQWFLEVGPWNPSERR